MEITQIKPPSKARQRVLDEAERQFAERGYAAVTLRDIADALEMRHASLYHHAPGGKAALFSDVMERSFHKHAEGIQAAIDGADTHIKAQLGAVAAWFLAQPPMDLVRMMRSDMPQLEGEEAQRLMRMAFDALLTPIARMVEAAHNRGEIIVNNPTLVAGGFLSMIQGLQGIPTHVPQDRHHLADDLIDMLLDGIRARD